GRIGGAKVPRMHSRCASSFSVSPAGTPPSVNSSDSIQWKATRYWVQHAPQVRQGCMDAGPCAAEAGEGAIFPQPPEPAQGGPGAAIIPGMTDACNIAAALPRLAAEAPDRIAMRCPGHDGSYRTTLTYGELDARSDAIAAGLALRRIVRGTRVVVMVRPTPEIFLLMFALFKAGAVPVLVDPGIDRRALKQCLDEAEPHAFIGIPLAHFARTLLGWAKSAMTRITTGRFPFLADATLAQV